MAPPPVQPADYKHLVRVVNTDLDGRKPIVHALLKIKGIGPMYANAVLTMTNISKQQKTGELTEQQITKLEEVIKNPLKHNIPTWMLNRRMDPETGQNIHLLLGELDFTQSNDIKMMKKTKSYKGLRHQWGLTVRGQRTKSNFRHNKGKITLGVQRKKAGQAGKEEKKK